MSPSHRFAKKDIYDLDYKTNEMRLLELFNQFKIKSEEFNQSAYKTIFDLNNENKYYG